MKAVIQIYKSGQLKVAETPPPQIRSGWMLVRNAHSLISAGTEKTKVDIGRKSLLGKAMARPDLVKKVIVKARQEGLLKAWETVSDRLDTPTPLGYSCAGQVIETCGDVDGLRPGDWVACGGDGANHAEIVCVPKNLVVPIPEGVGTDHAAFATIGAIAMQGVRQAEVRLGEKVAVIGLGLVGLLTVQLLKASGCRVFGIDVDPVKLALGKELGCEGTALADEEALEDQVLLFTGGHGVDATIITAGTTSNRPIEQAGAMTREKGRVVVIGAAKMDIPREPYYLKEIDVRLSRSYGPGRYDSGYEEDGNDYPYGYVRFTERRNMACFLELLQGGQLKLSKMVTHRFPFEEAANAYDLISGEKKEHYLGILLEYNRAQEAIPRRIECTPRISTGQKIKVGVIGAGKYAVNYLLPAICKHKDLLPGVVCTNSGVTAQHVAQKFGFEAADSDVDAVIAQSDALLIATRHNEHANLVIKALQQGKPVFVEKPLAITEEQLDQVTQCFHLSTLDSRNGSPLPLRAGERAGERCSENSQLSALNSQPSTTVGSARGPRAVVGDPPTTHPSSAPLPLRTGERAGERCPENSQLSALNSQPSLMVGFNRRFAPATEMVRNHFKSVIGPKQVCIRVNAGPIPADHWIQDPKVGGGRLIGEGCHFVDLAVALIGASIKTVSAVAVPLPGKNPVLWDSFTISLVMDDGSIATVNYTSVGDTGLAKERIEIYGGAKSAVIDDFRAVELWSSGRRKRKRWWSQDKGQRGQMDAWVKGLQQGNNPIPVHEIFNVHAACLAAVRSIQTGSPINL